MVIYVITAGLVKPVNKIYTFKQGAWREVLLAQTWQKVPGQADMVLKVAHDRYQRPPTNLRGVKQDHASCTIAWDPPAQATHYRVMVKPKKAGADAFGTTFYKPNENEWTAQNFWDVTGLDPGTEYTFTVQAKRTAVDNTEIISQTPSNAITLYTGHPPLPKKNPSYGTTGKSDLYLIDAAQTDTWTSSYHWGAKSHGPDVIQGYYRTSGLNGRGVVSYSTARRQLSDRLDALNPDLTPAELTTLLSKVVVTDAKIDQIVRKGGGAATVTVHVYPCKINFSSTAGPGIVGGAAAGTTFTAPAIGKAKDEVDISKLETWATEWLKPAPAHTGMLIYNGTASGNNTTGHNGYCVLRSARASAGTSPDADWQLKLWVRWNYSFPETPAVWR
jgi:hypothetical protein